MGRCQLTTQVTETIEPGGATLVYAHKFYDALVELAQSEPVEVNADGSASNSDSVLVFRGKLMDVFQSLGLSATYYTRIRRIFIKYDCVSYLQRGTRSYDSVLVLNHAPPSPQEIAPEDLTDDPSRDTIGAMADRLEELEREVSILTQWRESLGGLNILEALRDIEKRLPKREA